MIGRGVVALIKIEGVLTDTSQEIGLLHKHAENSFVRAIVLRVETPGGLVGCSQELHREILKTRKSSGKPIIASMGNVAASGGYYVACAAKEIYANPGTVTGSIGVLFQSYNLQGISQKIGFGVNTIKSGKFKDTGSSFREMTPEERQVLQGTIDDTYDQFLEAVLEGRRVELARAHLRRGTAATTTTVAADGATSPSSAVPPVDTAKAEQVPRPVVKDYLRSMADGRVLSGRQALEFGLVDHLGDLNDAIDRAAQLAGLRGKPYILQEKRKTSLWDLLEGRTNVITQLTPRLGVALEYRLAFD
jgi:protease-4